MKFFLDTANLAEIEEAASWGVLAGVTTNPTLYAREGGKLADFHNHLTRICEICDGPGCAGLQHNVRLYALGRAGLIEYRPDSRSFGQAHDRVRADLGQSCPASFGQRVAGRYGCNQSFADD